MIDKKYIAGFIDGEGCIIFGKHKDKRLIRGFTIYYRVGVSNQNKEVLEEIRKRYGGIISKKKNENTCWELIIAKREEMKNILADMIPHLIVKKQKAKELLNLLKQRDKEGRLLSKNTLNLLNKNKAWGIKD